MDIEGAAPQLFRAPPPAAAPANNNPSTNPNFVAIGCLDTYHDFMAERGKFQINTQLQAEINRFPNIGTLIAPYIDHPEEGVEHILGVAGSHSYACTVSGDANTNLRHLISIFNPIGYTVAVDGTQDIIHVVCDAGPMHIGSLAKNVSPFINLVHLVTPATACDSSGIKRGSAFNKPVIFKDGGQEPSGAAFFSGATIFETSNPYDSNTAPIATIHVGDQLINIDSSGRGPSVDMLNAAIANRTKGRYSLDRFPSGVLFDIKRCADIDQIKHTAAIKLQNPTMKIVFVTIDRICAYIAVHFFKLPTILQTFNKKTKYFRIWTGGQVGGNSFPIKTGGFNLDSGHFANDERVNYDTEQDYINLLASLAADKLRSLISTKYPQLAAACSYYTIEQFAKWPLLQSKYIEAHEKIHSPKGFPINTPAATAKIRHMQRFDFRELITNDFTQQIGDMLEELREIYNGDQGILIFLTDKPVAREVTNLLFTPPAGHHPTFEFLSLAIFSDFIEFPNNPGMSVISSFVFNEFLPMNPHIPVITDDWSESTKLKYSQLLINILPVALQNGTLSKQSLGLAGGNKKTFRRRRNRNRKTSRNKLRKRKHI